MSHTPQPHEAHEPPAMGEQRARWGDGDHDHVATDRILRILHREVLFAAIGLRGYRSGLIQRVPPPQIPYEQNAIAADQLKPFLEAVPGGDVAVTGGAGVGKSTLVQDGLSHADYPFFVPYYAFLPDGEGNPRDRGEALTFFQDVIGRLDTCFPDRYSIGIAAVAQGREALREHMAKAHEQYVIQGRKTMR